MEKYICDVCGYILEIELEKTNNGDMSCPICKNKMLTEEEFKSHEEISRMIEEDKDDDMTSKEDAMDDEVLRLSANDFLIKAMEKNIKEVGNDKTYKFIENETRAKIRFRYRHYFILAGGQIPDGKMINIEIKNINRLK